MSHEFVPRSDIVAALLLQSQQRPRRAPTSALEGLGLGINSITSALIAKKLGKKADAEALADNLATIDAFTTLAGTPGESAAKLNLLDTAQSQFDLGPQASSDFSLGGAQPPKSAIASALAGGHTPTAPQSPETSAIAAQLNPGLGQPILRNQLNQASTLGAQARLGSAEAANPNARIRSAIDAAAKRSPRVAAELVNAALPNLINQPETFTTLSGEEAEAMGFAPGSVVSINDRTGVPKVVQGPQAKASTIIQATLPDGTVKSFTDPADAIDFQNKNPGASLRRLQDKKDSAVKPPSGFSVSADGFSLVPIPGGPGDIQAKNFNLARSRGVAATTANLFGGLYDPITGEVSGVSEDQRERMLDINVNAMKLLQSGKASNPLEAVQLASDPTFGLNDEQKGNLDLARQAIENGKDPDAVRQKLKDLGIDPSILDQ